MKSFGIIGTSLGGPIYKANARQCTYMCVEQNVDIKHSWQCVSEALGVF